MTSILVAIVIPLTTTGMSLAISIAFFFSPCILDMARLDGPSIFLAIASKNGLAIILTDDLLSSIRSKKYPAILALHVSGVVSFVVRTKLEVFVLLIPFPTFGILFFGTIDFRADFQ